MIITITIDNCDHMEHESQSCFSQCAESAPEACRPSKYLCDATKMIDSTILPVTSFLFQRCLGEHCCNEVRVIGVRVSTGLKIDLGTGVVIFRRVFCGTPDREPNESKLYTFSCCASQRPSPVFRPSECQVLAPTQDDDAGDTSRVQVHRANKHARLAYRLP